MGMAASQARYLGLSARKTNIEYEGQQINQARTALSNQSANLFNHMLTMSVPTAPSTTDYTTVQYSYKDGVYGETIDEMYELSNQADGYNWLVKHHHYSDIYTGIKEMLTNPQVYLDPNASTTYSSVIQNLSTVNAVQTITNGFNVRGLAVIKDSIANINAATKTLLQNALQVSDTDYSANVDTYCYSAPDSNGNYTAYRTK